MQYVICYTRSKFSFSWLTLIQMSEYMMAITVLCRIITGLLPPPLFPNVTSPWLFGCDLPELFPLRMLSHRPITGAAPDGLLLHSLCVYSWSETCHCGAKMRHRPCCHIVDRLKLIFYACVKVLVLGNFWHKFGSCCFHV